VLINILRLLGQFLLFFMPFFHKFSSPAFPPCKGGREGLVLVLVFPLNKSGVLAGVLAGTLAGVSTVLFTVVATGFANEYNPTTRPKERSDNKNYRIMFGIDLKKLLVVYSTNNFS
jgi:hypothetical protein